MRDFSTKGYGFYVEVIRVGRVAGTSILHGGVWVLFERLLLTDRDS